MVNKKGILRIVEAGIAVLIVLSVLLVVTTTQRGESVEQDFSVALPPLLDEIAKNTTLRDLIVSQGSGAEQVIEGVLSDKISGAFEYDVRVCDPSDVCGLLPVYPGTDIFAAERIVSSSLETFLPKKLKIFLWRKLQ